MNVNLADVIPSSTLDWPSKHVTTIFLRGCPLKCSYCSNAKYLDRAEHQPIRVLTNQIKASRLFIDGIVVSGGEPLMQAEQTKYLCGFARKQKIKAAVHTNGYYPHELRGMLTVLDAIFLDFKAPLGKYYALTKNPDAGQHLVETLKVLEDSRRYGNHIYWEIRTTIFEGLNDTPQAIREIAKYCKLADVYVVQQGRPEVCPTPEYRDKQPVSEAKLVELANAACAELDNVKIRAHTVLYGERWIKKGGIQFIPD